MKECPYCKIKVGGNLEKCPLCQNTLTGEGERDYWPRVYPDTRRRKAFKIVSFCVISVCIISVALDYLFIKADHLNFSPLVLIWLLLSGWLLETVLKKHYNILQTMFVGMIAISIMCQLTELFIHFAWDVPYQGITQGYIIPIACSGSLIANFVLSLVDRKFTEHSMIYTFLNILVGVVPWICLLFIQGTPPMTWSICMVINVLAFVGLFVFKGRTVIAEFKKRFHM